MPRPLTVSSRWIHGFRRITPGPISPVGMLLMAMLVGSVCLVSRIAVAQDDYPVCGEEGSIGKHCWAQLASHPGCQFFSMQRRDVTTDVAWSGTCEDGRATGEGVLSDASGNHAEGRFAAGRRDGVWKWRLADGVTMETTYADGLANGPTKMTFPVGRQVQGYFEDNMRVGTWERRSNEGYIETGPYVENKRHGAWTITWPDGYEAVVPYIEGKVDGDVTVTHRGALLGVLVYRDGERIGPGLPAVIPPPLPPPPDP